MVVGEKILGPVHTTPCSCRPRPRCRRARPRCWSRQFRSPVPTAGGGTTRCRRSLVTPWQGLAPPHPQEPAASRRNQVRWHARSAAYINDLSSIAAMPAGAQSWSAPPDGAATASRAASSHRASCASSRTSPPRCPLCGRSPRSPPLLRLAQHERDLRIRELRLPHVLPSVFRPKPELEFSSSARSEKREGGQPRPRPLKWTTAMPCAAVAFLVPAAAGRSVSGDAA